jgi:hypothetical protein
MFFMLRYALHCTDTCDYPIIYARTAASVDLLVAAGADINIAGNFDTALSSACRSGRLDFARYLISVGADVNAPNKSGATPLMLTFGFGVYSFGSPPHSSENLQVVKMLLDAGARVCDVDREGNSVLHFAALKVVAPAAHRQPTIVTPLKSLLPPVPVRSSTYLTQAAIRPSSTPSAMALTQLLACSSMHALTCASLTTTVRHR